MDSSGLEHQPRIAPGWALAGCVLCHALFPWGPWVRHGFSLPDIHVWGLRCDNFVRTAQMLRLAVDNKEIWGCYTIVCLLNERTDLVQYSMWGEARALSVPL